MQRRHRAREPSERLSACPFEIVALGLFCRDVFRGEPWARRMSFEVFGIVGAPGFDVDPVVISMDESGVVVPRFEDGARMFADGFASGFLMGIFGYGVARFDRLTRAFGRRRATRQREDHGDE